MLAALRATPGLGVAAWHADRLIRNADDTEELIRVCAAGKILGNPPGRASYDLSTATRTQEAAQRRHRQPPTRWTTSPSA